APSPLSLHDALPIYGGEKDRSQDPSESEDARVRPLELALLRGAHVAAHQALDRGLPQSDEREHGDSEEERPTGGGGAVDHEPGHPREQAHVQRPPLTEPLDHRLHEASLDGDVTDPDEGQREPDGELPPPVAVARVDHEHAWQDLESEEAEEVDAGETDELPVGTQERQRARRVRPPPGEPLPGPRREGLREHDQAIPRARERHDRGGPERKTDAEPAQHATERGPDDEPDPPRGTDHAEGRRAT